MGTDYAFWLSIAGTLLAIVFLCLYYYSIIRELDASRRETSRYSLFAARDHLVMLVADGVISEDDPIWRRTYFSVNYFLDLDKELNIRHMARRYIKYVHALENNPELRDLVKRYKMETDARAKEIPEFGAAIKEINEALQELVRRRTKRSPFLAGFSLGALLFFLIIAFVFVFASWSVKVTRKAFTVPSVADLMGLKKSYNLK